MKYTLRLALMFQFLLVLSCSSGQRAVRLEAQQKEILTASVSSYWHGVRWQIHPETLSCVEQVAAQQALLTYLLEQADRARVVETQIVSVSLAEDAMDAVVLVRYDLVLAAESVVRHNVATQKWYRDKNGRWCLEMTPEEMSRLSPTED